MTMDLIIFALSVTFAFFIGRISSKNKKFDGVLTVNTTNPDKEVFSIEIEEPLFSIIEKDCLYIKIDNTSK